MKAVGGAHTAQHFALAPPPGTQHLAPASSFENNHFTEMYSGSEVGSYLRIIDFVYHSTLGLRIIKKKISTPLPNEEWKP